MSSKLDYVVRSLSRGTNKKYETYVINSIWNKINNSEVEFATQQYVKDSEGNTRYIDMYFPQIKFAIEVDEWYHSGDGQCLRDGARAEAIRTAILDSTIADSFSVITFKRVKIFNDDGGAKSIEQLNRSIDQVVSEIKLALDNLGQPIRWDYDEDSKMANILKRGYLMRGDNLTTMKNIIHVFGKDLRGWRKSTYPINGVTIWSPTLSFNGSDRNGWINTINEDLSIVYESGTGKDGKGKNPGDAQWDLDHATKRVVFLKYKDALGNKYRRFLGVYMCGGYDNEKNAEIWKLTSDKYVL